MRLWTLHPGYLDPRGLIALWREALLAQKVLARQTRGYRRHPQLQRFETCSDPAGAIAAYLTAVAEEGRRRGYRFDISKIGAVPSGTTLETTIGQLAFEWGHLMRKLQRRAPELVRHIDSPDEIIPHPVFHVVPGPTEGWERGG